MPALRDRATKMLRPCHRRIKKGLAVRLPIEKQSDGRDVAHECFRVRPLLRKVNDRSGSICEVADRP